MRLENEEKIIFKVHPHWLYVTVPEIALIILGSLSKDCSHTALLDSSLIHRRFRNACGFP